MDYVTNLRKAQTTRVPRGPKNYDALNNAAIEAELRHTPVVGGHSIGDPHPEGRIEVGEVETSAGRVRVAISRDSISVHGVNAMMGDVAPDLRRAIVASAASFSAAESDEEQSAQRAVIGAVVDAVMRRHQFLLAAVKESKKRERRDA
jgi:hypothetical protein